MFRLFTTFIKELPNASPLNPLSKGEGVAAGHRKIF